MTNQSPPNPQPSPDEERIRQRIKNRTRQETTDEWIAILVAFGTIGAILLWTLGFRRNNFVTSGLNSGVTYSGELRGELELEEDLEIDTEELTIARDSFVAPSGAAVTRSGLSIDNGINVFRDREAGLRGISNPLYSVPAVGAISSGIGDSELEIEDSEVEVETELEPETVEPETAVVPETEAEPEAETEPETAVIPEPEAEEPTQPPIAFDDVPRDYWAYPFLQELGKRGRIAPTEDNNFEPNDLITRAGMATLIAQAFDDDEKTVPTKDFNDISEGNIIAEDVDKAVSTGFMKGYSKDEFRPLENIPRYQVLVALATGLDLKPSGDPVTILQGFSDRDSIPNWAISQVAAATEAGLAVNRPDFNLNSLNPETPATRAEVAAMIYQALKQQGKVPAVESDNIVPLQ